MGADGAGTTSALVRGLYAGPCEIAVRVDGQPYRATVTVRKAGGFTCAVEEGALTCR